MGSASPRWKPWGSTIETLNAIRLAVEEDEVRAHSSPVALAVLVSDRERVLRGAARIAVPGEEVGLAHLRVEHARVSQG